MTEKVRKMTRSRSGNGAPPSIFKGSASAAASEDTAERMARLSECERYLLRAMPFVPLYKDVWTYLKKPFVKGLGTNSVDRHQFKYLWIDRNWRAA